MHISIGSDAQTISKGVKRVAPPRPKKVDEDPAKAPIIIIFLILNVGLSIMLFAVTSLQTKVQMPTKPINIPKPSLSKYSFTCGAIKLLIAIKGIALASNIKVINLSSVEDLSVLIARGSDPINIAARLPKTIIWNGG